MAVAPGETALITNLGVFHFDLDKREFVLVSTHPGVTLDDIGAASGFEVMVSPDVSVTESPSPDVLRVLREEVDPLGIRRLEFVAAQDRQQLLDEFIVAERGVIDLALAVKLDAREDHRATTAQ